MWSNIFFLIIGGLEFKELELCSSICTEFIGDSLSRIRSCVQSLIFKIKTKFMLNQDYFSNFVPEIFY